MRHGIGILVILDERIDRFGVLALLHGARAGSVAAAAHVSIPSPGALVLYLDVQSYHTDAGRLLCTMHGNRMVTPTVGE